MSINFDPNLREVKPNLYNKTLNDCLESFNGIMKLSDNSKSYLVKRLNTEHQSIEKELKESLEKIESVYKNKIDEIRAGESPGALISFLSLWSFSLPFPSNFPITNFIRVVGAAICFFVGMKPSFKGIELRDEAAASRLQALETLFQKEVDFAQKNIARIKARKEEIKSSLGRPTLIQKIGDPNISKGLLFGIICLICTHYNNSSLNSSPMNASHLLLALSIYYCIKYFFRGNLTEYKQLQALEKHCDWILTRKMNIDDEYNHILEKEKDRERKASLDRERSERRQKANAERQKEYLRVQQKKLDNPFIKQVTSYDLVYITTR